MAITMTRESGRLACGEIAAVLPAEGFEQYRIGRLLELRAVIDSLRAERVDRVMLDVQDACERIRSRSRS